MVAKEVAKLTYEQAIEELDQIIEALDTGEVSVDELAEKFERAVTLLEELNKRIVSAKEKVEQLGPKLEELIGQEDDG
jgi:exodeoxyribonuclease VII small subunit